MHAIIREGQVYFACEESGAESMFSTDSDFIRVLGTVVEQHRCPPSPAAPVQRVHRRLKHQAVPGDDPAQRSRSKLHAV